MPSASIADSTRVGSVLPPHDPSPYTRARSNLDQFLFVDFMRADLATCFEPLTIVRSRAIICRGLMVAA